MKSVLPKLKLWCLTPLNVLTILRENDFWVIDDKIMEIAPYYTHLGIERAATLKGYHTDLISKRISTARQTTYALMGAGPHGLNGICPNTSIKLWITYILPRLLFGMETLILNKGDVAKLEKYHRQFLRQIMHLPERTSIEGIYLLSGRLPIEMEIHKKQLTMFGNIIRSDCTERNLAIRQLSLKADNSNSWFAWIRSLLLKYSLQDAIDQLNSRLSKSEWRHCINRNVEKYWSLNFKLVFTTSANDKSSLKNLSTRNLPTPMYTMSGNTLEQRKCRSKGPV